MKRAQIAIALGSLSLLLSAGACGGEDAPSAGSDTGGGAGGTGGADVVPDPCPPGRVELQDGKCINPGVPAGACGEGFMADNNDGCTAILPAGDCPEGLMAIPGESACREIAPCGDGDYGSIPVDASTIYVNQSYAGGGSDGSLEKPWTNLIQAVAGAPSGSLIAIAAGKYLGDISLTKPLRLWGRCPSLVEIKGIGASQSVTAVLINAGASGSEIHDLAITSPQRGVTLLGATDVLIDRAWLHDIDRQGIYLPDSLGTNSLTVRRSLMERATRTGIYAGGSALTFEESVLRAMRESSGQLGKGIYIEGTTKDPPVSTGLAKLTVRRSVIEKSHTMGLHLRGGEGLIESTVVRDTLAETATGTFGVGVYIDFDPSTGDPAKASIKTSVIERSVDAGLFIHAATVDVDSTVVRDVASQPGDDRGGRGINIDQDDLNDSNGSDVTIRRSVVERSRGAGVFVSASKALLEATIVRDTDTEPDGRFGYGITAQSDSNAAVRATLSVLSCRVEKSHTGGITTYGSDTTVEHTLVIDTLAGPDQTYGDGFAALVYGALRGAGSVVKSHITKSARAGIASFGSDVVLKSSILDCNAIHLDGEGDGYTFEDGGANVCRCAEKATPCKVLSTKLAPPEPL